MTPASTEKVDFGKTQFNNKKHNQTQNDQNSGIDWFPQASESPIVVPGIRRQTKPGMGAGEAPIACRVAQQFCKNHGMKNLVPTMRIPQLIYSKCNHI